MCHGHIIQPKKIADLNIKVKPYHCIIQQKKNRFNHPSLTISLHDLANKITSFTILTKKFQQYSRLKEMAKHAAATPGC